MVCPRLRPVVTLCTLLSLPGLLPAQQSNPGRSAAVREILTLQDQRSVSDGALVGYLAHRDADIRQRALVALGNVQDTSTVQAVASALKDGSWRVRQAAAFALGQIGDPRGGPPLKERLTQETSGSVIARILEALGKCGSPDELEAVIRYRPPKDQELRRADQALAVARFALRNIRSPRSVAFAGELLAAEESAVQWTALYALWRSARDSSLPIVVRRKADRLSELARSAQPDVRRNLAMLLARLTSKTSRAIVEELERTESWPGNWRVRTEIVRALVVHCSAEPELVPLVTKHLRHRSANVRLATLAALSDADRKAVNRSAHAAALRQQLVRIASSSAQIESHRVQAIAAMARLFPSHYKFTRLLEQSSTPASLSAGIVRSLASMPSADHMDIVVERLGARSLPVALAAWETIPAMVKGSKKDPNVEIERVADAVARNVKAALLRNDMALTTLVAQAIADTAVMTVLNAEALLGQVTEDLMLAYAALSSPNDVEPMQALVLTLGAIGDAKAVPVLERALRDPDRTVAVRAASALKQITGADYSARIAPSSEPLHTDYDWRTLEEIGPNLTVEITTTKGTITLELLPDVAPFTVMSFVKLVRRGFYDGLAFHRVVPDFVIQGGDPRGDGWGGPGYAIRTEVGLLNYFRGMVGIASAGKDTEGCQFFITHSAEPHLDGRYTIFARVSDGMSVVDAIQVGDSINRIVIKN